MEEEEGGVGVGNEGGVDRRQGLGTRENRSGRGQGRSKNRQTQTNTGKSTWFKILSCLHQ